MRILFVAFLFSATTADNNNSSNNATQPVSSRYQLYDYLFSSCYNRWVIPRANASVPIPMTASYEIFSIHEVDEREQTVQMTGFLNFTWNDYYLRWNPSDFGNVTYLVVPLQNVWFPKIGLVQSTTYSSFDEEGEVRVYSDGTVSFSPHSVMSIKCNFDLTYYPFDTHKCWFQFEVWTYQAEDVALKPDEFSYKALGTSRVSSLWVLQGAGAKNIISSYGTQYSGCEFYIILQRKPLMQVFNVLLPMVLLSLLSLMVFRLPVESQEKISLSITILVAFSVWQLVLNETMPGAVDRVPIVVVYVAFFTLLSSCSLVATVLIVQMSLKPHDDPIPIWIRTVFKLRQKMSRKSQEELDVDCEVTWKVVAETLDAACFVVTLFIVIVSSLVMVIVLT